MHDIPPSSANLKDVSGFLSDHDHSDCVDRVLAEVEAISEEENLRLTPIRRRVLEILLEAHEAIGAYDLLKRLADEGLKAQPPVAYRALDFLQTHGFVHKIERLNAFVACMHPTEAHTPAFLICRLCNTVAEARPAVTVTALGDIAASLDFQVESMVVEAQGICESCRISAE